MPKYFIVIILVILLTNFLYSENRTNQNSVKGTIVEEPSGNAMVGANVLLYNAIDSLQIFGIMSDNTGRFQFTNLNDGNYYLQITYIGFDDLITPLFTLNNQTLDLGILGMKISPIHLNDIEITGEKKLYNNNIDRKIYNVKKDVLSETGSVSDLIQNIPSVSVDIDGNISLRGSENVTIFINGKPSLLMRKNSATVLQQMPANSIEQIEVITNPSAKYKPDGTSGIINIVLKKEKRIGLNGTIIGNIGNEGRYNGSTTLNYNPGDINLFGSYGIRQNNRPRSYYSSRIQKDISGEVINYYEYSSKSESEPFSHIASMGMNYDINDRNSLEISGDFYYDDMLRNQNSQTTFSDANHQITSNFTTDRTNDEYEKEYEISSNFEHNFEKEDHTLSIELNYSGYDETEDNHYDENYTVPGIANHLSRNLIRKSGQLYELYAEYAYPINDETEFEAGYVGEFLHDDIRYTGEDYIANSETWNIDANKTNQFLFDQDIHALYTTFSHSIDDFSFLAGLRAEQTLINSELVTSDTTIPNNYFKLFPTLHIAYEMDDNSEFQLNYSRRVRRADSDEHNPFAEYSDPRNMEAGNPKLKPEQIHSIEFGYHYKQQNLSVLPTIYYRYKYDAFTEIRQFVNDTTMLSTFANIANDRSAGMEFIIAGDVKKFLSLNFSADAYYQVIDASNIGYNNDKSSFSWNTKLAANIRPVTSNLIQLNAYYRSARLTPQGNRLPMFLMNLGMRQDFLDKKASLTFTVSDIFKTLKWKRKIDTNILFEETSYNRNSQIFYLGLTYRFGNSHKKEKDEFRFEDAIN